MAAVKRRQHAGDLAIALHFLVFMSLAFLVFSRNPSCLSFNFDGLYWTITHDLQAISRTPFSQLGADPVQGSFDAYVPAFREYLLPNLLAMPFSNGNPNAATAYTIYAGLMILSVYLLARALRVDRAPALFAGLLYPLATLPMFIGSLPAVYVIYALVPHATEVTSLTLLTLACFWALEEESFWRSALLALGALFCVVWIVLSSSPAIVLTIPLLAFFAAASVLPARRWQHNVPRVLVGILILVVLASLGMFGYIYSLYKYTATSFFADEFLNTRSTLAFASAIYQEGSVGRILAVGGFVGAAYSAFIGKRRLQLFAISYLAYTIFFHVLAFAVTVWVDGYAGPSPLYFEFMLWPLNILFTAIAIFAAIDLLSTRIIPRLNARHRSLFRYSLLGMISLALLLGNALAAFNERAAGCPKNFSPILSTQITERLRQAIEFHSDTPFRGLVATFTGYQQKSSVNWFDLYNHDHQLWKKTGNDHRAVGLWRYNIPTLFQYGSLTTPPYYLMLSRFLSRPEDQQMRAVIVLTKPNEQMLKLWGVRFVIADFDVSFGTTRMTLPVSGQEPLRLVELEDFNRGNYSPTKVLNASDFRSALNFMRAPSFDGSREVVTDANLAGGLQPADGVELKVEKDGFSLRASSPGQSVLVLPAQFSHCWSVQGNEDAVLFRANIMQLGISFKGRLDASLQFRYGPILAGGCRLEDVRDMERFDLRGAR